MDKGYSEYNARPLKAVQILLLSALLVLASLPHFWNLSLTVTLFFLLVVAIRLASVMLSNRTVPRWLVFAFLGGGMTLVITQYSGTVGKDFGVSLLVAMLGLKLLEIRVYRDAYVVLFLTGFLLVTQFLYNQDISLAFYIFTLTLLILVFLQWLNQPDLKPDLRRYLSTTGKLSLQAIPVMIILFVFFPRLGGPLWGFDTEGARAMTGITGSISPGSISQLSQSSETAFRVKFDDPAQLPDPDQRYWRGPVIVETDGINWEADEKHKPSEVRFQAIGEPVSYQITLEASRQQWVFGLDLPAKLPDNTYITPEYAVRSRSKILQRTTFPMVSYPLHIADRLSARQRLASLELPNNITPRMRELVNELQTQTDSKQAYADAVLDLFNRENFVYTLQPPPMRNNPADEFLFDKRRGFCEHYATSFVLLMRMADIPARVVAGYQGGEWNPAGEHLIVRQSDAHAWAEIWLDENGWIRVDPTAAVAPERIEMSIDPEAVSDTGSVMFKVNARGMFGNVLRQAVWIADSLDLNWHRWVVGFSQERQHYFLDSTGLDFLKDYQYLGVTAVVLAMAFAFVLGWMLTRKPRQRREAALRHWQRFCHKLEKQGVNILDTEGPQTVARHASDQLPQQADAIQRISSLYISIRYGGRENAERLRLLQQLVSNYH